MYIPAFAMFAISAVFGGQGNAAAIDTRAAASNDQTLNVMIYRGKNACKGCPESIEDLLEVAYPDANVTYAGPNEEVQINADTLSGVDVFAYGGGPGMSGHLCCAFEIPMF